MGELKLFCTAFAVATLAGLNLYLTVFLASLSLIAGWVVLGTGSGPSPLLAHPLILFGALALYFIEFIVDKVRWWDTVWDAVHTLIRPLGAVYLAITILGGTHSFAENLAVVACAGAALMIHLTKTGTRLIVHHSPEIISSRFVSLLEDILVILGMVFIYKLPITSGFIALLIVGGCIAIFPRIYRAIYQAIAYVITIH